MSAGYVHNEDDGTALETLCTTPMWAWWRWATGVAGQTTLVRMALSNLFEIGCEAASTLPVAPWLDTPLQFSAHHLQECYRPEEWAAQTPEHESRRPSRRVTWQVAQLKLVVRSADTIFLAAQRPAAPFATMGKRRSQPAEPVEAEIPLGKYLASTGV